MIGIIIRSRSYLLSNGIIVFVIVILTLFFGLRDLNVGVDATLYCFPDFYSALHSNTIFDLIQVRENEFLYLSFVYLSACISNEFSIVLIELALITILFYFYAISLLEKWGKGYIVAFLLILLIFYSFHFVNLIRQSIAIPIILCAFLMYDKRNCKIWSLLLIAIAFGFHRTSIVAGIPIYLTLITSTSTNRKLYFCIAFITCVAILGLLGYIVNQLADSFEVLNKYSAYTDSNGGNSWQTPKVSKILILFLLLNAIIVYYSKVKKIFSIKDIYIYSMILLVSFFSLMIGVYTASASRLFLFYFCIIAYYMLQFIININSTIGTKYIFVLSLIAFVTYYSIVSIQIDLIDYSSDILGIEK